MRLLLLLTTATGKKHIEVLCSLPFSPVDTSNGLWIIVGYYAVPADGDLFDGPLTTSPFMTVELCVSDCKGYSYLALENGKTTPKPPCDSLALTLARR